MNAGLEIQNLRRKLNKKPKSKLFARLADELRRASLGEEEKLEEALRIADRGLEANPDFLQGRLVRSRILLEKGDLTGAKMDLEFVAEKDPFCLSAQKLLLETLAKLGESPQTETHQKILGCLEPDVAISPKVLESLEKAAASAGKTAGAARATRATAIAKTGKIEVPANAAGQKEEVFAALDNILGEDLGKEAELKDSIFKTFDNIFESKEPASKAPESKAPESKAPESKAQEIKEEPAALDLPLDLPDLPPASAPDLMPYVPPSGFSPTLEEGPTQLDINPKIDDILDEQLASKIDANDLPDLTSAINALLEPTSLASQAELLGGAPASDAPLALERTSLAAPSIDDILNEQLASKIEAEELPDLMGDINALLSESSPAPAAPNIDNIINEQLSSKIDEEELPNLMGDINALLLESSSAPAAPSIDNIVNEQLSSKIEAEELPDLMGDMETLLSADPSAPSLDDIVNEQLASKVDEKDLPDLTSDLNALLEPSSLASPAAELTPLVELAPAEEPLPVNLPDLINEMDAMLTSEPPAAEAGEPEIELMPYVPPSKAKAENESGAPNIDALIKEQLASKVDIEDLPDLMGDMLDLLEPAKEAKEKDAFAQNPTPTLAELYLSQGLAQKAADVYKELLARDPSNAELKAKLAQAQSKIKA